MLIEFLWMLATLAFWFAGMPLLLGLFCLFMDHCFKCDCSDHKHW